MLINRSYNLQLLHIGTNHIGDEGITAIAKTLSNNRITKKLNVSDSNITITGAEALAAGLTNNHSIKKVDMKYNNITMGGAIAILKAAIANGVCREVRIDNRYKNNDRVKEMIAILEERKRREVKYVIT